MSNKYNPTFINNVYYNTGREIILRFTFAFLACLLIGFSFCTLYYFSRGFYYNRYLFNFLNRAQYYQRNRLFAIIAAVITFVLLLPSVILILNTRRAERLKMMVKTQALWLGLIMLGVIGIAGAAYAYNKNILLIVLIVVGVILISGLGLWVWFFLDEIQSQWRGRKLFDYIQAKSKFALSEAQQRYAKEKLLADSMEAESRKLSEHKEFQTNSRVRLSKRK